MTRWHEDDLGSIPACAGKPYCEQVAMGLPKVDPRVRGEAFISAKSKRSLWGRSPRARGSRRRNRPRLPQQGSIPACAGKPRYNAHKDSPGQVDPRVRGEARAACVSGLIARGRSPRARGSLMGNASLSSAPGSIPACAGKPGFAKLLVKVHRVDPRVRGEARVRLDSRGSKTGRSPRARGSRVSTLSCRSVPGSIPACAGKP